MKKAEKIVLLGASFWEHDTSRNLQGSTCWKVVLLGAVRLLGVLEFSLAEVEMLLLGAVLLGAMLF